MEASMSLLGDLVKGADVAVKLLELALDLYPPLRKSIALVEGVEHPPRLAEIMRAGNVARKLLEEP
jgi:hypothetical protein